jgi:hypothetical protein
MIETTFAGFAFATVAVGDQDKGNANDSKALKTKHDLQRQNIPLHGRVTLCVVFEEQR